MRSIKAISGIFVLIILLFVIDAPVKADIPMRPINPAKIRAVVVGIDEYKDKPLRCCVNDANAMEAIFKSIGCEVTKILNRDATKEWVVQTLNAKIAESNENDIFIFSYSGHGSHVYDKNGDETDGQDETLCLLDSDGRTTYNSQLVDDDLDSMISKCRAKVSLLIFDSCFSGGASKGVKGITGERGKTIDLSRDVTTHIEPDDTYGIFGSNADKPSNPREIVITASQSDELSKERGSLKHGLLTYYFTECVTTGAPSADKNNDKTISINEIYDYCNKKIIYDSFDTQHMTIYQGPQANSLNLFNLKPDGQLTTPIQSDIVQPIVTQQQLSNQVVQNIQSVGQVINTSTDTFNPKYYITADIGGKYHYKVNDWLNISISIDGTCYLYFFDVSLKGNVTQVFPNGEFPDNLVQCSGKKMTIPDMIPHAKGLMIDKSSPKGANFFLIVASPYPLQLKNYFSDEDYGKALPELESFYGSRGSLSLLIDAIAEGHKDTVLVAENGDLTPQNDLACNKSVNALVVTYYVD